MRVGGVVLGFERTSCRSLMLYIWHVYVGMLKPIVLLLGSDRCTEYFEIIITKKYDRYYYSEFYSINTSNSSPHQMSGLPASDISMPPVHYRIFLILAVKTSEHSSDCSSGQSPLANTSLKARTRAVTAISVQD